MRGPIPLVRRRWQCRNCNRRWRFRTAPPPAPPLLPAIPEPPPVPPRLARRSPNCCRPHPRSPRPRPSRRHRRHRSRRQRRRRPARRLAFAPGSARPAGATNGAAGARRAPRRCCCRHPGSEAAHWKRMNSSAHCWLSTCVQRPCCASAPAWVEAFAISSALAPALGNNRIEPSVRPSADQRWPSLPVSASRSTAARQPSTPR